MAKAKPTKINLALQGGGAHGAFTWGVVDRLLQDDGIQIAGISGTSAGALNAAAIKSGLVEGGPEAARVRLKNLWNQVAGVDDIRMNDWLRAMFPSAGVVSKSLESSLPFLMSDALSRVFSPYNYGPFYKNPLEDIVAEFSYDAVCADSDPKFFVSATAVRTGKIRVFSGREISPAVLMASACLPTVFQAVEIDGEDYWDGGYTCNPALFPLFEPDLPSDIVIVNINPLERDETPREPRDILNRINEISFNTSLMRELRAINFVQRLISDGKMPDGAMKKINVHMISDDTLMRKLGVASKMIPTAPTLNALFDAGQAAAEAFLGEHRPALGKHSSLDLPAMYS
ncbi:patatin-like phospholipase family protein [Rhodobacteraceae bacterium]|nr:patatin-like phospholipase family protein [Paracoccaceae bacterium]